MTAALALAGAPTAYASLSLTSGTFEVEGDAFDDIAAAGQDWADVYAAKTAATPGCPTGATACAFATEPTLNSTIFTGGGSKDPIDIPSWKWKDGAGGLPDKDNLLHSFAARYTDGTDDLLYFGSDRYDNSGDAHQAFWFFQDAVALKADGTFSGVHQNGDLLIISEFSNGGTVSTINVYEWLNGALVFAAGGSDAKCNAAAVVAQQVCGIVNAADGTASPWPFLDKKGRTAFGQGEFFEGGINLSDPAINLAGRCFASFASETRSSTSTTAVLKDFVLSGFGSCGSGTVTTPMQVTAGATGAAIPAGGISIGTAGAVQVRDRAVVTVTGANISPAGDTVSFRLCGPVATTAADPLCTANASNKVELGSVSITSAGNPATVDSPIATVTSAGRYCFGATYSGNASKAIPASEDSSAGECFTVTPVTPTIATTAGPVPAGESAASVLLGQPVSDTATLSGTALQPRTPVTFLSSTAPAPAAGAPAGGSLTFSLYGPDNCSTLVHTSAAVLVSGDGTYSPAAFTPTLPGVYHWKATYTGNAPNTLGSTHNALCSVSAESVTVRQLTPTISTAQSFVPNDSATVAVSGGGGPTGSVLFSLFDNANCDGLPLWTQTVPLPAGSNLSKTVSTTSTVAYTSDRTFSWLASYTSTNASHTNASHRCGIETASLTIDNDTRTP